jgi:hypothetical protein
MHMEKMLFEIPEENEHVIYAGRTIKIDGQEIIEVDRFSKCAYELLTPWGRNYCAKNWLNPVFMFKKHALPTLIGFVSDTIDESPSTPSSSLVITT